MAIQIEDRVDTLESLVGQFIVQTNLSYHRLEKEMKEFKDEMKEFKDEMSDFKTRSEQDRREMNKRWGDLANKMGTFVEDIVAPNIPRIAREFFGSREIEFFAVRVDKRNTKEPYDLREFDALAICDNIIILNETKSTPRKQALEDFADFIKGNIFFNYFPE